MERRFDLPRRSRDPEVDSEGHAKRHKAQQERRCRCGRGAHFSYDQASLRQQPLERLEQFNRSLPSIVKGMRTAFAYLSLLLAAGFFGLLLAWLLNLAHVGGLKEVPRMLYSLGWEATTYGAGLTVLGTAFLCAGLALLGRHSD
jgi:hypothetical protein